MSGKSPVKYACGVSLSRGTDVGGVCGRCVEPCWDSSMAINWVLIQYKDIILPV